MFLFWFRQYVIDEVLAWMCECDSSQVRKYNNATLVCFSHVMWQYVDVPPRAVRDALGVRWRNIQINLIGDLTKGSNDESKCIDEARECAASGRDRIYTDLKNRM